MGCGIDKRDKSKPGGIFIYPRAEKKDNDFQPFIFLECESEWPETRMRTRAGAK